MSPLILEILAKDQASLLHWRKEHCALIELSISDLSIIDIVCL